jgi:cytoskeleton protein RodZ
MTDTGKALPAQAATAGSLLRAAREQQGIHIAVLAAAIKISSRKLDALEGDRYNELPDPSFTRALAQTVARALKIDPQPVLALLPPATAAAGLDSVGEGLNTPFKGRPSSNELSALLPRAPLVWAGLALLAAAALLLYWPYRQSATLTPRSATPSTSAADLPAAPGAPAQPSTGFSPPVPVGAVPGVGGVAAGPAVGPAAAAAISAPAAAAPVATIDPAIALPGATSAGVPSALGATVVVSEPVWLEVVDGTGSVVCMRTIQPGEVMNFDQKLPLKLKVGNATAAKLTFRGEPVDLIPLMRGNVARVVLN